VAVAVAHVVLLSQRRERDPQGLQLAPYKPSACALSLQAQVAAVAVALDLPLHRLQKEVIKLSKDNHFS